jgi:hypothetical protein
MSNSLREMAEQAFSTAYEICEEHGHEPGSDAWVSYAMATLAELVVHECCEIIVKTDAVDPGNSDNLLLSIEKIRNHFNIDK